MNGVLIMKILYGITGSLFLGSLIWAIKVILYTSTMEDKNKKCKNSH